MGQKVTLRWGDREFQIDAGAAGEVRVGDTGIRVTPLPDGSLQIEDGVTRRAWAAADGDVVWVYFQGTTYRLDVQREGNRRRRSGHHHGSLMAPMPATVRRVEVRVDDRVTKGQTLIILEAMKMELPVRATSDGTIEAVNCREGELVQAGAILVEIEETG